MNITGIITEYNPFHNGHLYHMKMAKQATNADYLIVVMSGDYMQRGTPAILDKYTRAHMALQAGADLVLEIPCVYACGSAEYFAEGAIGILHDLGSVNAICFGAETADQVKLNFAAEGLLSESPAFQEHLQTLLAKGVTYPKARSEAFLSQLSSDTRKEYESLLQTPNNILGIEYTKALKRRASNIQPYPIERIHSGYHEETLKNQGFSSATAIRSVLNTLPKDTSDALDYVKECIGNQIPDFSLELLLQAVQEKRLVFENDFSSSLHYKLLQEDDYTKYADWNTELSNRTKQCASPEQTFSDIAITLKSRQYTLTRIQRALLHLILNMEYKHLLESKESGYHSYAKVLGFKRSASPMLKQLRKTSSIPIIQQLAKADSLLTPYARSLFLLDAKAHKLYQTVLCQKNQVRYEEEFSKKPLILP